MEATAGTYQELFKMLSQRSTADWITIALVVILALVIKRLTGIQLDAINANTLVLLQVARDMQSMTYSQFALDSIGVPGKADERIEAVNKIYHNLNEKWEKIEKQIEKNRKGRTGILPKISVGGLF